MKNSAKDNSLVEQIQSIREERQKRTRIRNTNNELAQKITDPDERKKALQKIAEEDIELAEMSANLNDLKAQEREERRAQ